MLGCNFHMFMDNLTTLGSENTPPNINTNKYIEYLLRIIIWSLKFLSLRSPKISLLSRKQQEQCTNSFLPTGFNIFYKYLTMRCCIKICFHFFVSLTKWLPGKFAPVFIHWGSSLLLMKFAAVIKSRLNLVTLYTTFVLFGRAVHKFCSIYSSCTFRFSTAMLFFCDKGLVNRKCKIRCFKFLAIKQIIFNFARSKNIFL